MTLTPHLALPLVAAAQAQKHVTVNEALNRLDALIQLTAQSRSLAAPPDPIPEGARYIVPAGATGAWAGHDGALAFESAGVFEYANARIGWLVWVIDEAQLYVWDGSQWGSATHATALGELGINMPSDPVKRLSVRASDALFTHDGAGHRLAVNKAAAAETASLILQSNFSGRAEIGLTGSDDLRIKTSANGTSWIDALVIDRATGQCQFPNTPAAAPPGQNLLINGDFQINQRNFAGGALAAGSYGFDRWKAAAGGATLSRSGFALTLSAGGVQQVVEPAVFGLETLAGQTVTLSVDGLAAGTLNIGIASASGVITSGAGRRRVTLTIPVSDNGNIAVALSASGGPVTFSRVRLELGTSANAWMPRALPDETGLCQRYFWAPGGVFLIDTFQAIYGYSMQFLTTPVPMRTAPSLTFTVLQEANIYNGERLVTGLSPQVIQFLTRAASQARVYAQFGNVQASAEL